MAAHRNDLESDLSAIHHIPDPLAAPAHRMFRLGYRIAHYDGVIRHELQAQARSRPKEDEDVTMIAPTPEAIAASPFAKYITMTTTEGGGDE